MSPVERCAPDKHRRTVGGFSWVQLADGSFKRVILRDCRVCKDRSCESVWWVNTETPICTNCLSQEFTVTATEEATITKCIKCGNTDMVTLVPLCELLEDAEEDDEQDEEAENDDD